jgi:Flp pilus assembly pilin Flp
MRNVMKQFLRKFYREEDGQDMVEYSLLLGFIALAGVALMQTAGTQISTIWTNIQTNLASAATASS